MLNVNWNWIFSNASIDIYTAVLNGGWDYKPWNVIKKGEQLNYNKTKMTLPNHRMVNGDSIAIP